LHRTFTNLIIKVRLDTLREETMVREAFWLLTPSIFQRSNVSEERMVLIFRVQKETKPRESVYCLSLLDPEDRIHILIYSPRGPLSLVSTPEELLDRKVSAPV
jgi:hypothetical protein